MEILDRTPKEKTTIEIHPNIPKIPFNMSLTGKSGSGKSNLLLNLLPKYKKHFKGRMFIFTDSADETFEILKRDIGGVILNSLYDEDGKDIITRIFKYQKEHLEKLGRKKLEHVLLVFDDFITDNVFNKKRSVFTKLFSQGRHYNISIALTTQQYTLIPSDLRRMSWYDVYFAVSNSSELKILTYENCNAVNLDEDEFKRVYTECIAEPFSFMYIDKKKNTWTKRFGV